MSILAAVEGTLEAKSNASVVVRVGGGILLEIFVPTHDLQSMPSEGEQVRVVTHLIVREDDLQLYGFATEQGRNLFESLLGVSQVGPKAALGVLSVLAPADLAAAIVAGDAAAISQAPGVGKRTADRIILDLQAKVQEQFLGSTLPSSASIGNVVDPALQWLIALGYSAGEARQALSVERQEDLSTDERVKRALQRMGSSD